MSNVYTLHRRKFPPSAVHCLEKLLAHARYGDLRGIAFIGLLDGGRYIADVCGDAHNELLEVRRLLIAFEAKLARRRSQT